MLLKEKALEIAEKVLPLELKEEFQASNGWLNRLLKRTGFVKVVLHGEGGEVNEEEANAKMNAFRTSLEELCGLHNIPRERIFNADQTGLFFQKLPNTMDCKKSERNTVKGAKKMKDKNKVTIMVCTSAAGLQGQSKVATSTAFSSVLL
jgi:hypothetical protein